MGAFARIVHREDERVRDYFGKQGNFRQKSWGVLPKSSLVLRRRWAVAFTKARRKGRKVRCAGRDAVRVSTDKGDEERKKRRKS